ncbi:MAG: hypothetical protein FJX42_09375 [Alphaproteobacteria bacterium]|nr:hypothetical protein [Alphaproteobacteria bacterium]
MLFLDRFTARPLIIAEIGAKYADLDTIKTMVRAAKGAGADIVKFQTYQAETISTPGSFFTFEDGSRVPQFEWFKKHELSDADHVALDACCRELGIAWISTPSHPSDADYLEKFNPIAYKTGSDDLTNTPFLSQIARKGRPMIVSTGMCTLGEIEKAVETIHAAGVRDVILLHCVDRDAAGRFRLAGRIVRPYHRRVHQHSRDTDGRLRHREALHPRSRA